MKIYGNKVNMVILREARIKHDTKILNLVNPT